MTYNQLNSTEPQMESSWSHLLSSHSWFAGVATLQGTLENLSIRLILENLSLTTWIYLTVASIFCGLFYYYMVIPINLVRDLSEVGWDLVMEPNSRRRGRNKREMVREARRLRKIGNLPPVFPNGWFVLLESDELKPGQVRHVAALGENFAVFRTMEGVSHVLDAYCPHLGANMAIGGMVRGDCLECPFHSWRFRGEDGQCTSIPYTDKVPNFAKVKKWQSCEVNSYIFVWFHAEHEDPTWRPEPISQIASGEWRYGGRNEYWINAHIQEIPENGGDVAHLNAIHGASLLAGSDLRSVERVLWSFARHVWSATWTPHPEPQLVHAATMNLHHEVRLFDKFALFSMNVKAEQIGPGYVELFVETSLGPIVIVQCVTPIEPMLQKVVHRFYCAPYVSILSNLFVLGECIMFERDIMVWNHKRYEDKPLLVKEDRNITKHRRWYNQFYSENSPKFSFVKETIDW